MTTVEEAVGRPDAAAARRARRIAVHTFRPRRSWPALIAAVVLFAVAALAAAEVISGLLGAPLRIPLFNAAAGQVAGARWSDPSVRVASVVLAVIGVVLIGSALLPGRGHWLPLRTGDADLVVGLSRPALRRALGAAARDVAGVRGARVSVRGRRVLVRVDTDLRESAALRDEVDGAVAARLEELAPLRGMRTRTRVRFSTV
ncbi:DUF6286 domain-containing protein [Nocardiopsis coralliicola]